MRSVVLLSGGLDSTVSFTRALQEGECAVVLHFDYGQLAARPEAEAARRMAARFSIPFELINLPWLGRISRAEITGGTVTPAGRDELEGAPAEKAARRLWVPNRNGLFINIGAAYAEALEADQVVTGFNIEEANTFPDNSPEYVEAANRALWYSTMSRVRLHSYTQGLTKTEIVALGRAIGAPLKDIWSCYSGGTAMCWGCPSCMRLRRALEEDGSWDWFAGGSEDGE